MPDRGFSLRHLHGTYGPAPSLKEVTFEIKSKKIHWLSRVAFDRSGFARIRSAGWIVFIFDRGYSDNTTDPIPLQMQSCASNLPKVITQQARRVHGRVWTRDLPIFGQTRLQQLSHCAVLRVANSSLTAINFVYSMWLVVKRLSVLAMISNGGSVCLCLYVCLSLCLSVCLCVWSFFSSFCIYNSAQKPRRTSILQRVQKVVYKSIFQHRFFSKCDR
jgi:hypothetical protein